MKLDARLLAVLVTGLSACHLAPDPGDFDVGSASLALTTTCGARRWIGRWPGPLPTPPCNAGAVGWTASPLFAAGVPALSRYCAYKWSGVGPPLAVDVAALNAAHAADQLGEDCPVILPQAPSVYGELLGTSLRASLNAQTGTVDTLGVGVSTSTPSVRVAVVDTAPDSDGGTDIPVGDDRHGDTLAGVVRDIGCGSRGCALEAVSVLGLPWLDETTRGPNGGHVGRLSDVAVAVEKAIRDAHGVREHLIINLSLGWEDIPLLAECAASHPKLAPTVAVYDVLQYASCTGALVIAAAGNDAGGRTPPQGMICPARWEALPGCTTAEPMLHAVGGVDYAEQPIVLTRPGGRPQLAATSVGGIGWDASTASTPPPLTGSSVAAAVTSGVAGVVWAERPVLSRRDLMNLLYTSGFHVGPADTAPWATSQGDMRRISLCWALDAAGVTGLGCAPASPLTISSPPLGAQVFSAAALEFSSNVAPVIAVPVQPSTLPRFQAPSAALSGGVFPQPVVPVCPGCFLFFAPAGTTFYAGIDVTISEALLVMETHSGTAAAPLTTPLTPTLSAGSYAIRVTDAPVGVTRAWLTGYADASRQVSVSQEILITPPIVTTN